MAPNNEGSQAILEWLSLTHIFWYTITLLLWVTDVTWKALTHLTQENFVKHLYKLFATVDIPENLQKIKKSKE